MDAREAARRRGRARGGSSARGDAGRQRVGRGERRRDAVEPGVTTLPPPDRGEAPPDSPEA